VADRLLRQPGGVSQLTLRQGLSNSGVSDS
jgi:hypothetical protein